MCASPLDREAELQLTWPQILRETNIVGYLSFKVIKLSFKSSDLQTHLPLNNSVKDHDEFRLGFLCQEMAALRRYDAAWLTGPEAAAASAVRRVNQQLEETDRFLQDQAWIKTLN